MRLYSRFFVIALCLVPIAVHARNVSPAYHRARMKGAKAEIRLVVRDDEGKPVPEASICAVFDMPDDELYFYGKTDTNGAWVVRGKTNGNYIKFYVGKDGFYGSHKEIVYAKMGAEHEVRDGKWQPYGADEWIELRRIRNPAEQVCLNAFLDILQTNVWIGVDLLAKDFVRPYGTGKISDIEIWAEWDGLPPWKSQYCRGDMRIPAPLSGGYYEPHIVESEYPYPYNAYKDHVYAVKEVHILNRDDNPPKKARVQFRQNSSLVLMTRCILDAHGILQSANYAYISCFEISPSKKGCAVLHIKYTFNPTPNDTNLEDNERAERAKGFIQFCEESQGDD